ncbi:MAG: hypothetical protein WCF99_09405 [Chloroflexales bacterium]
MHEQLIHELAAYAGDNGLSPSDLLGLPDGLRRIVTWITRRGGASLGELASEVGCDNLAVVRLVETMMARGLLSIDVAPDGVPSYRTRLASRRLRNRSSDRLRDLHE